MGYLGCHVVFGLAGLAPLKAGLDLSKLASGLGEGLVKSPGLLHMEPLGVANQYDEMALLAKDDLCRLEGYEPRETFLVDHLVAVLFDSE